MLGTHQCGEVNAASVIRRFLEEFPCLSAGVHNAENLLVLGEALAQLFIFQCFFDSVRSDSSQILVELRRTRNDLPCRIDPLGKIVTFQNGTLCGRAENDARTVVIDQPRESIETGIKILNRERLRFIQDDY